MRKGHHERRRCLLHNRTYHLSLALAVNRQRGGTIGNRDIGDKMKIHKAAIRHLFESGDQRLEAEQIFQISRELGSQIRNGPGRSRRGTPRRLGVLHYFDKLACEMRAFRMHW